MQMKEFADDIVGTRGRFVSSNPENIRGTNFVSLIDRLLI